MAAKIDIINAALALIGADEIADLSEQTTEAISAAALYETFLELELSQVPWRFCSRQVDLGAPDATTPEARWSYRYAEPAGTTTVRAVTVNDIPIPFDRYEGFIYCDAGTDVDAIADTTFRPSEAAFPPHFTGAFTYRLAGLFGSSITAKAELSNMWMRRADAEFAKARRVDAQQQTVRKMRTNRFLINRR